MDSGGQSLYQQLRVQDGPNSGQDALALQGTSHTPTVPQTGAI